MLLAEEKLHFYSELPGYDVTVWCSSTALIIGRKNISVLKFPLAFSMRLMYCSPD